MHDVPARNGLSRRETRWVLKRCGRRGHVLAHLDDAAIAERLSAESSAGPLLRCLRCGDYTSAEDPQPRGARVLGEPDAPVPPSAIPHALRGGHGRKLALLRLLAMERGGRGLLLLVAALGVAQLASSHEAVAEFIGRLADAAQPLGQQLGWDISHSATLTHALKLLGESTGTYLTIAWALGAYGLLQVVEGIGLWGGWRWAEYLAVIATSAFVPLEVYEILHSASLLKVGALVVNLAAVAYLVHKGRLFGWRGGHAAYLAEVRDSTLLADELRAMGRPTAILTSHQLI